MRPHCLRIWIVLLALSGLMAIGFSCSERDASTITVGAAMSLRDAMNGIGRAFEAAHPGVRVRFHFASSGTVATQIIRGAPLDVFASASRRHMQRVIAAGQARGEGVLDFAANQLVLIQPLDEETQLGGLADLPAVARIALGDPESVPAGRYAKACLEKRALWIQIAPRLIFAAHVRQVLDYVVRGEVDAGLVYATDARTRAEALRLVGPVPAGCHPPIVYPAVPLAHSAHPAEAAAFVEFLRSAPARRILTARGFSLAAGRQP